MAKTLRVCTDFESGTFYAFARTKNSPTLVQNPPPVYEHETYTAACTQAAAGKSFVTHPFTKADNDYAIGFPVRFTNVNATTSYYFAVVQSDGSKYHLKLGVNAGKLEVWDADDNLVATSAGVVFANDTDHLVELLLTFGNPGDVVVHVDEAEAVTANGEKFDTGAGATLELCLGGQGGVPAQATDVYFTGPPYVYSGAADVTDFVGPNGHIPFRHDKATPIPDIGDALDVGWWDDAAEIPFGDVNLVRYTDNLDFGVVTTDPDGCVAATPGPHGDARIGSGDTILGATWLVRWFANPAFPNINNFWFCYGKTPHGDPGVDNTTKVNLGNALGTQNTLIVSEAAGDVPTRDHYFQLGCKCQVVIGAASVTMYNCMCSLWVKPGLAFRGVHLGAGPVGRAQGREILVG